MALWSQSDGSECANKRHTAMHYAHVHAQGANGHFQVSRIHVQGKGESLPCWTFFCSWYILLYVFQVAWRSVTFKHQLFGPNFDIYKKRILIFQCQALCWHVLFCLCDLYFVYLYITENRSLAGGSCTYARRICQWEQPFQVRTKLAPSLHFEARKIINESPAWLPIAETRQVCRRDTTKRLRLQCLVVHPGAVGQVEPDSCPVQSSCKGAVSQVFSLSLAWAVTWNKLSHNTLK